MIADVQHISQWFDVCGVGTNPRRSTIDEVIPDLNFRPPAVEIEIATIASSPDVHGMPPVFVNI